MQMKEKIGDDCVSSKNFIEFSPMAEKDQLIVCGETKEFLFFIPRINSCFDMESQEKLKECLLKTIKIHYKNINNNAKLRKVEADEWGFEGKITNNNKLLVTQKLI